ncbi:MAG: FkbM family methyltransferase [Nitrospira sp.]|nr:FkbM family methyltransferase [Nitrospira sp.]
MREPSLNVITPAIPLVSVIIPTHNRALLLGEALTSVFAQEGRGKLFEVEVIVIDDASSDETSAIVRQFPLVRYLRFETNRGPAAARNAGIKSSKGGYVAFLDDDDLWLPNRLMAEVPILENQSDIGVIYGHGLVKDIRGNIVLWPPSGPSGRVFEEFLTRTDDFINIDTLLVRREVIDRAGYFDETVETMEHYEFASRLAYHCQWHFVNDPVARGRESKKGKHHQDIISGSNEHALRIIIEKTLRLLPDSPEADLMRRRARIAVCATIAGQRWWRGGGVESVRTFLLSELQANPWLGEAPAIWQHIRKTVRVLAVSSHRPLEAVRRFWEDVVKALGTESRGPQYAWESFLAEAAEAIREDGSAPFQAGALALRGLIQNPARCTRRLLLVIANMIALGFTRPPRLLLEACGIMKPEARWSALLAQLAASPNVFFVEVGANDGFAFDPIHESVVKHGWHGLLIEPLPDLFAQLRETYDGREGMLFENVAVADYTGQKTMIRVDPEAVELGRVPYWAKGIGSFYHDRNALGGQRISDAEFATIRPHIISETVRCDTLENLFQKHRIHKVDLLQIDVEGYDYLVLKQFDFSRFRPRVIRMEWDNLPQDEKQMTVALLKQWGYRTSPLDFDLIAWHSG